MYLRKLKKKDAVAMLEWMHDSDINQYFMADFNSYDLEKVQQFIEKEDSNNEIHYACVNEEDEYLGTVSLKHIDYEAQNAEYAISFGKRAHGTGAAQYATQEILKIAFEELKLERVYLNVLSENIRANRFYEKVGIIYEGEFKKHINIRGELKDLKWYRMLKEEYQDLLEKI